VLTGTILGGSTITAGLGNTVTTVGTTSIVMDATEPTETKVPEKKRKISQKTKRW
jgi:hypothetical protein